MCETSNIEGRLYICILFSPLYGFVIERDFNLGCYSGKNDLSLVESQVVYVSNANNEFIPLLLLFGKALKLKQMFALSVNFFFVLSFVRGNVGPLSFHSFFSPLPLVCQCALLLVCLISLWFLYIPFSISLCTFLCLCLLYSSLFWFCLFSFPVLCLWFFSLSLVFVCAFSLLLWSLFVPFSFSVYAFLWSLSTLLL